MSRLYVELSFPDLILAGNLIISYTYIVFKSITWQRFLR